jgi:hypothetical protein
MNDKLSGIENNLNDRAVNLSNKVKKAEPSFRFKGNQVQIELNAEISGNTNVVLSELGRQPHLINTRQRFSTLLLTCLRFVLICSSS